MYIYNTKNDILLLPVQMRFYMPLKTEGKQVKKESYVISHRKSPIFYKRLNELLFQVQLFTAKSLLFYAHKLHNNRFDTYRYTLSKTV